MRSIKPERIMNKENRNKEKCMMYGIKQSLLKKAGLKPIKILIFFSKKKEISS